MWKVADVLQSNTSQLTRLCFLHPVQLYFSIPGYTSHIPLLTPIYFSPSLF